MVIVWNVITVIKTHRPGRASPAGGIVLCSKPANHLRRAARGGGQRSAVTWGNGEVLAVEGCLCTHECIHHCSASNIWNQWTVLWLLFPGSPQWKFRHALPLPIAPFWLSSPLLALYLSLPSAILSISSRGARSAHTHAAWVSLAADRWAFTWNRSVWRERSVKGCVVWQGSQGWNNMEGGMKRRIWDFLPTFSYLQC